MLKFLHDFFTIVYGWVDKEIIITKEDALDIFKDILNEDESYDDYAPKRLLRDLDYIFDELSCLELDNNKKKEIYSFIDSVLNMYCYDSIKNNKKSIKNDRLYYKCVLSEYYVLNTLNNTLDMSKFSSLKAELIQVGKLIDNYYKIYNSDREDVDTLYSTNNYIKAKMDEIMNRYEFKTNYPFCAR